MLKYSERLKSRFNPTRRAACLMLAAFLTAGGMQDEARAFIFSGGVANGALPSFSVPLTLSNLNTTTSYTAPNVSYSHPFADGDIPVGGSVTLKDSNNNPVVVQMDAVSLWPSGFVRWAVLSHACAETFAASSSKAYTVGSSVTAPNNTPNSGTWGGTTQAQWAAALIAAAPFKAVFTGFDAGAATYDMDISRIVANYNNLSPSGYGTSYPRGGWSVVKQGPVCVEFHFWEYIRNTSTGNTQGYVRFDLTVKATSPSGPYEIEGWANQPNIWNTVPLSSTAEQFNQKQGRFAAVCEIFNGATRVAAFGGPNDPHTTTVANANFNTTTNRLTAALNSFFPQTGVSFTSSGTLPGGNMAAGVVYWPTYPSGTANPYLVTSKSVQSKLDNAGPGAWQASHPYGAGEVISNNNILYFCTTTGTSASSGGPTGTGTAITDGTAVWDCVSLDFTDQGTGTITVSPVFATFPSVGFACVDQLGNPIWVGAGTRPEIFPGHDFTYLTSKTKYTPRYCPVTTVAASATLITNYLPSQAVGGLPTSSIDSSGDGVGDNRIGYISEWGVGAIYRPTDRYYVYSGNQISLSMLNYPAAFMHDESGGHPFIGNNGTNNSGTAYTNLPGLIPTWNSNNTAGSASTTVQARGATWSGWSFARNDWTGYNGQYYYPMSHFPALWQVPYLKTGRHIFFVQGLAHATAQCFMTYQGTMTISSTTYRCLIGGDIYSEQLRGFGWGWRTLSQCMYMMPNAHPLYNYVRDLYDDNAKYQAVRLAGYPANQGVLGFFKAQDPSGVGGGVGGWAPWMGFFAMHAINMDAWRAGLTTQEAANRYWKTASDYYANQWKIFDPAIDTKAPNYLSAYRLEYGPNAQNWATAITDPAALALASFNSGNVQMTPYPSAPYDNDAFAGGYVLSASAVNATNWYGNPARMALVLRILAEPTDTLAAAVLSQFTANISARNGVSAAVGSFNWGYSGTNALTFCSF